MKPSGNELPVNEVAPSNEEWKDNYENDELYSYRNTICTKVSSFIIMIIVVIVCVIISVAIYFIQ